MKYTPLIVLLLVFACGKPSTESATCGTLEAEISFDENNIAKFDGDGHPVTVKSIDGKVEVEDPERQLGVGTCEFNGTFSNIIDGIN